MRRALAELGAREISPFALASIFLLIAVFALWVPIRLLMPDARWGTATVTEKYVTRAEDVAIEHLSYTFIADGRAFIGSSQVHPDTYARSNVGDSLAVRYSAGDPSVNRHVADYFVLANEGAVGFFSLFMIALTPLAWWNVRSRRSRSVTRLPLA